MAKTFKVTRATLRLVKKYPRLLGVTLALWAGHYGYEVTMARPPLLYQGAPQAVSAANWHTWFRILRNHGFMVGYSDLRGNPLWVMYALTPVPPQAPRLKRPSRFDTDWRSLNRIDHDDYARSGYDRGHNAPNYAMSRLNGNAGQADSFLMTNVSPQRPHFNQKFWQRLEEVEISFFAKNFGKVWVITGPIFGQNSQRLSTSWRVEVPTAFYKIYVTEPTPTRPMLALAFVVPQTAKGNEPLTQFVTRIKDVQAQTGLNFLVDLDDKTETHLEGAIDVASWQLKAVDKTPSRYR